MSRRALWKFSRLVLVAWLAADTVSEAASIRLLSVNGHKDSPAEGAVVIDTTDGGRVATQLRCAQHIGDLGRASWYVTSAPQVQVTRVLPGFQVALDNIVSCEIAYTTGENIVVSTVEDMRARTGAPTLPRNYLHPSPGVLFNLANPTLPSVNAWPLVQYNDQGQGDHAVWIRE